MNPLDQPLVFYRNPMADGRWGLSLAFGITLPIFGLMGPSVLITGACTVAGLVLIILSVLQFRRVARTPALVLEADSFTCLSVRATDSIEYARITGIFRQRLRQNRSFDKWMYVVQSEDSQPLVIDREIARTRLAVESIAKRAGDLGIQELPEVHPHSRPTR